jgi:hypothetical protein
MTASPFGSITDANPHQPLGVLGVSFANRTNDVIAAHGLGKGIVPVEAAKVTFDHHGRIIELGNGPVDGNTNVCSIG